MATGIKREVVPSGLTLLPGPPFTVTCPLFIEAEPIVAYTLANKALAVARHT